MTRFTKCGLYSVQTAYWILDVSRAYETGHLLHNECSESFHVRCEAHTLGSRQTCTYYSDMCEVLSLKGSGILPAVEYCYLDMQIQIGLAVQ